MNETLMASIGLDTSSYVRGLDVANQQASKFKQRLEGLIGPGFLRGAGIATFGLSIAKVLKLGKLPVRIGLAGQYMIDHPDTFGQKWNLQLMVVPVIPKLIQGTLF
jgi:hypothetical protein